MNREIKFRVWDTNTDKMFDPRHVQHWDIATLAWENYTPMQFTGLTDKNGKEIYEGDILINTSNSTYHTKYKVVWDCAKFIGISNDGDKYGPYTVSFHSEGVSGKFEVIGNIYENPELLNA